MNLISLLEKYNLSPGPHGEPFVDYNGARLGYGDILSRSERLCAAIDKYGFARGAVCGLVCFNHINFILYFMACLRARVVPIIINAKYSPDEMRGIIGASGVKAVITDNIYAFAEGILTDGGGNLTVISPEIDPAAAAKPEELYGDTLSDGTLFMLITSASGGRPKIVKKNAAALQYQADKLYPQIKSEGSTRYFTNVPPSHSYGLEFAVFGSIYNGAPLYLRDFNFSGDALEEIALNSITHIFSVPPFILSLADYKISSGMGFDRLEMVVSAGMPLLPGLSQKFFGAFNFNIASVYGITEVGCVSFKNSGRGGAAECASVNNDVGFPIDGNDIIVAGDSGKIAEPLSSEAESRLKEGDSDSIRENIGRVIIRKKVPDGGYYRVCKPADAGKWRANFTELETDDSGYVDSNGSLHLLARSSSFVNIGGTKVNALDIEKVLRSFGLFRDVLVFGLKDAYLGEKLAAALVVDESSKIDADEVRRLCGEKLPAIKVPRDVYFLRMPFPRTAAGKVRFDKVLEMAGILAGQDGV
jgi:acyl-CoA synthetase (AMP-forming)/AMP-acid ligase II